MTKFNAAMDEKSLHEATATERCSIETFLAAGDDRKHRIDFAIANLVESGILASAEAASLRAVMESSSEAFDVAVTALALAADDELADAFARIFGAERMTERPAVEIQNIMSPAFLRKFRVFPLLVSDGTVSVAVADPTDLTGLKGCAFAFRRAFIPIIVTASELETLFQASNASGASEDLAESQTDSGDDAERLRDLASAEPAVRLCNRLISEAAKSRASDIHLEPCERDYRIRFRIDGALTDRERLTRAQGLAAVSRLKILSGLDIAERRRPQDGRFSFAVAGKPIDLRVVSSPNIYGESLVTRLLLRDDISLDLRSLGFSEESASRLHKLADRPHGILLLTGPTGSGKTTTLYALLRRLSERDLKILTIEDPVEYHLDRVLQTQVNPVIGLTFATALRSFLRQDPDIIMVGEMRDAETAHTAVQAALTGHLVLSTLHTNDAVSAVTRLIDLGVANYLVASTLIGVVGQRLVRRLCSCRQQEKPGPLAFDQNCPHCYGQGYFGRLAVVEVLAVNAAIAEAIREGADEGRLRKLAAESGLRTMLEDGAAKAELRLTTMDEFRRVVVA